MYAIDLFDPYWEALRKLTGIEYTGQFPPTNVANPEAEAANPQLRHDIAFRVIADHVRTLTFALTDGAIPSNEGRGYVLRRILRRAARFARQALELREPFMHQLVDVVVDSMGDAFPELKQRPHEVRELILQEEKSFGKTLERGIELFEDAADRAPSGQIASFDAFKLHDTYGFPIDLTQIMAAERGMTVDIPGYEKLMEEARQKARSAGKGTDSPIYELPPATLAELEKEGIKPTDDLPKYKLEAITARVMAIWNGTNLDPSADPSEDQEVAVILDRTKF
jgi:alanyl-tRNA synthetase